MKCKLTGALAAVKFERFLSLSLQHVAKAPPSARAMLKYRRHASSLMNSRERRRGSAGRRFFAGLCRLCADYATVESRGIGRERVYDG